VLTAGNHKIYFSFVPADPSYKTPSVQKLKVDVPDGVVTVTPGACPVTLDYGQPLPSTCPTAVAVDSLGNSVAGKFAFTDGSATGAVVTPGEVLLGGNHTILFAFTPADTTNYKTPKVVKIKVEITAVTPEVIFTPPATIATGSTIPDWSKNGDATVAVNPNNNAAIPGAWTFSPAVGSLVTAKAGKVLTFKAVFVPTDLKSYIKVEAAPVTVTVQP
jgi:hypothetical protein